MLKKLENNNRGATSYVERGLIFMVVFIMSIYAIDLIELCSSMIIANHQLNYVAYKCQYQNGFLGGAAEDWGEDKWSNKQFQRYLSAGLGSIGVDGDIYEWDLSFAKKNVVSNSYEAWTEICRGGKVIDNSTLGSSIQRISDFSNTNVNYLDTGCVRLRYDHRYRLSGRVLNLSKPSKIVLYQEFDFLYIDF